LAGLAAMFALYKLRTNLKEKKDRNDRKNQKNRNNKIETKAKKEFYAGDLTLGQAVLPYAVILGLSLLFQLLPAALRDISVSFEFPGFETALGHAVLPETGYSKIRLFGHPAVKLLCASVVAIIIYKRAKVWDSRVFSGAVKKTVKKGIPATLALLALGNMSLIMMDSGMTYRLAQNVADLTGNFYPLFAPFFGVLASFLTGNNTNSNVLFGSFQYTIAQTLDVSGAVMSAAQSISGSVGVAIGPTLVLMGAIATKQDGQESLIFKKLIGIILLIASAMGIINYILLQVLNYGA
jgi:lactate permease